MKQRHCFIESSRLCTLKCKSAFKRKKEIDCIILWALNNVGWINTKWAQKAYAEYKKKK